MATDDVIANLVRDLQPVRPLPLPRVRFAQWGLVAVPVMAIVMAAIGPRIDLVAAAATWSFQAHSTLLVLAAASSALAALALVVPGEPAGLWRRWSPVAAVASWTAWLFGELVVFAASGQELWPIPSGAGCVAKAFAFGITPGIALTIMLGRGAPADARATMVFASLATAAAGALGAELTCPLTSPNHLLLWHAGPVVAAVLAALVFGRPLFERVTLSSARSHR